MSTLELEKVLAEAPSDVVALRSEIGGVITHGIDEDIAQPVIEQYAEASGELWADIVVDTATTKFGESIENIGRAGIIWHCGEVIMKAAEVEAEEITKSIDTANANQSIIKKLVRMLKRKDPFVAIDASSQAFKILDEEIATEKIGTIRHVEDLRPIIERSARRFIVSSALELDARQSHI